MFVDEKANGPLRLGKSTTLDYYFIDDIVYCETEARLLDLRNSLIARNYTDTGILSGSYEDNTQRIAEDFATREDYFSFLLFERTSDWDWLNAVGTASFFLNEDTLPGFEQMPQQSIDRLYEALDRDMTAAGIDPYCNGGRPKLMELGRFAINAGNNREVLYNVVGSALQTAAATTYMSFRPKTHFMLCCNKKHSRAYKKVFGFTPLPETLSSVYNGKEGIFSYLRLSDIGRGKCGPVTDLAVQYQPDVHIFY
ncbi:MAG: N-acyl amino acid synthase FeeM domain-containing protein [Nanobdellota archaeon]